MREAAEFRKGICLARYRYLFLYHFGLTILSLFPAVILLLITHRWCWPVAVILAVNLSGLSRIHILLSLSFYVLKPMAGMLGGEGFAPEQMIISMRSQKTLRSLAGTIPPHRILLLLPHCLQNHRCVRRITFNPYNCDRCGKCPIGSLLDLADRKGVKIAVATGGTLARRHISEQKPLAVVAVACPRDLGQGMLDAYPVPVTGVENSRPVGDCLDTSVDVRAVEETIDRLAATS
jgi:hypothetical protein